MGYVISIGAGFAVGLGMLIFALVERSKRRKAEKRAGKAAEERKEFENAAAANAEAAEQAVGDRIRADQQVAVLRKQLHDVRMKLATGGKPKAIKEWLDEELKDEVV
jgi:hypothetical protein